MVSKNQVVALVLIDFWFTVLSYCFLSRSDLFMQSVHQYATFIYTHTSLPFSCLITHYIYGYQTIQDRCFSGRRPNESLLTISQGWHILILFLIIIKKTRWVYVYKYVYAYAYSFYVTVQWFHRTLDEHVEFEKGNCRVRVLVKLKVSWIWCKQIKCKKKQTSN